MATTAKTTRKKSTKKTAARTSTANKPAPAPTPLFEREPAQLLETAGYAVTGVVADVVDRARRLPGQLEALRHDAEQAADEAPARLKEAPSRLEARLAELRERLTKDLEHSYAAVQKLVDAKADDGRKAVAEVRKDERVARVLDQAVNTRSQLKAALTSARKMAKVAGDAAAEQGDVARTQAKAAATSTRKTAKTVVEAASDATS